MYRVPGIPFSDDPKQFLMAAMNCAQLEMGARIAAAEALMPYFHARLDGADEDDQDEGEEE